MTTTEELLPKNHSYQFNYSWESSFARNYSIDLLDKNLLLDITRAAVINKRLPEISLRQDEEKILESLELIEGNTLKNAAVVLFGTKFSLDFHCELQLARFKGITRSEFLDAYNKVGNIFTLLEEGMLFVRRHIPVAARIEPGKLQRVETPLIPFPAIREALINALVHRDYSIGGSTIKLAIYDDRMEISSDGGLPAGVMLEMILEGHSKRRNPIISEVLYKAGLIEKWGRGIQEMISTCRTAGVLEPQFNINTLEFKVVFRFPKPLTPQIVLLESSKDTELTERQQKILEILSFGDILKVKDIIGRLDYEGSDRMIRYDLNFLKELGLIQSKGATKIKVWFIRK